MTGNALNNDQFPTEGIALVLALLLSIPLAQTLSPDQAAVMGLVYQPMVATINQLRRRR